MGRFDMVFSFASLALIGISVICLCKTAEYRSQAKFATERYEEMKTSETKFKREADRKVLEATSEWKAKIQKMEREMEKTEKEMETEYRSKVEKIKLEITKRDNEITKRDELIQTLQEQMVRLSNDAVKVIAQYRNRRTTYGGSPTIHAGMAGNVVDRSCDSCGGKGKVSNKETCSGCKGQGYFVRTSPGGITTVRDVYGFSHTGTPRYTTTKDKCNVCGGRGWTRQSIDCPRCNGVGRIPLKK